MPSDEMAAVPGPYARSSLEFHQSYPPLPVRSLCATIQYVVLATSSTYGFRSKSTQPGPPGPSARPQVRFVEPGEPPASERIDTFSESLVPVSATHIATRVMKKLDPVTKDWATQRFRFTCSFEPTMSFAIRRWVGWPLARGKAASPPVNS